MTEQLPVIAVVGATATGKTALGAHIAELHICQLAAHSAQQRPVELAAAVVAEVRAVILADAVEVAVHPVAAARAREVVDLPAVLVVCQTAHLLDLRPSQRRGYGLLGCCRYEHQLALSA